MTQQDLKQSTWELINTMIKKNCYIKGYGEKFRVTDKDHNPIVNISNQQMNVLKLNGIVERKDLVYHLNVLSNPFAHAVDIKLPTKE